MIPAAQHTAIGKLTRKTKHIARFNNTLRQHVSHLVREALSFSKKPANHIGAINKRICHYNLTELQHYIYSTIAPSSPPPRGRFVASLHPPSFGRIGLGPGVLQLDMESQCRLARCTALGRCRSLAAPAVARASVPIGGRRVRRSLARSGQPDRTRSAHMTRFGRVESKPPCRSAAATFRAGRRRRRGNRSYS